MAFGWHVDKFTDWFAVSWSSSAASAALTLLTLACWSLILGRPQTHQKQNIPCFLQAERVCSIRLLLNWLSRLESHPLSFDRLFTHLIQLIDCAAVGPVKWAERAVRKNCNIGDLTYQMTPWEHYRVVQKPSFLSNWKIDSRHKIFWLFRSKAL